MARQRTELAPDVLEALKLEIAEQIGAGRWNQTSLARAAGYSQPAVNKAVRGEAGRDVAEALLKPLGFKTLEEIVQKHRTAVTANDVARFLDKYKALAETLRDDPSRWDLSALSKVIVEARRNPPRAQPDGQLLTGSWSNLLDQAAGLSPAKPVAKVGGVAEVREQIRKPKK